SYGYGSIGGSERRPWGLAGGREGTTNYLEFVRDGVEERWGRVARVSLAEGQIVRSVTGTGGGFGDPRGREPERVRECVRAGDVTRECAREVYAVALDPQTLEVDSARTAALRAG